MSKLIFTRGEMRNYVNVVGHKRLQWHQLYCFTSHCPFTWTKTSIEIHGTYTQCVQVVTF